VSVVQELHEDSEQPDVTRDSGGGGAVGVSNVLGVADTREVRQFGGKSASQLVLTRQRPTWVNSSLEMPSPVVGLTCENHCDLFWAFQPKRLIVPSLPCG